MLRVITVSGTASYEFPETSLGREGQLSFVLSSPMTLSLLLEELLASNFAISQTVLTSNRTLRLHIAVTVLFVQSAGLLVAD